MGNNVVDDYKAVNDNTTSLPSSAVTARRYHHGNLRAELLAQAERSVREQGVDALSLRELARAAGVSHAAPRRHFPDRQALLDALAENGFARLGAELRAAGDTAGDDFGERLQAIASAYVRFATDDAALLELMFAGKHRDGAERLHIAAESAFSVLFELITQGQAEGVLAAGQPERVGVLLFATVQGIASLLTSGIIEAGQLDELVADAIAHFLRGQRVAA